MKVLNCKKFSSEEATLAFANEEILTKPYAAIVSVTFQFTSTMSDKYSIWWTEYTETELT